MPPKCEGRALTEHYLAALLGVHDGELDLLVELVYLRLGLLVDVAEGQDVEHSVVDRDARRYFVVLFHEGVLDLRDLQLQCEAPSN